MRGFFCCKGDFQWLQQAICLKRCPRHGLCLVLTEDGNGRGLAQVVGVGRGVEMKIRLIGPGARRESVRKDYD